MVLPLQDAAGNATSVKHRFALSSNNFPLREIEAHVRSSTCVCYTLDEPWGH